MQATDLDLLFDGLSTEEAKQMRRILAEWRIGDEHSFPVQLALLTRAQWHAAAQIPVLLKQSLADHRQQTTALLKHFSAANDAKSKELGKVIAAHKEAADTVLTELHTQTATAKRLLSEIDHALTKGTAELKRFRDEFVVERHRLAEERVRYEQQKNWGDWVIFAILLLAMVAIGIFVGWKWH